MKVFTIGFTKTSAESFFNRLQKAGVKRVIDVRLNNVSQLAGFAKKDDLRYFLKAIGGIDYSHEPMLAPTQEMLDAYKKDGGDWSDYERRFLELIAARRIEDIVQRAAVDGACLPTGPVTMRVGTLSGAPAPRWFTASSARRRPSRAGR